VSVWQEFLVIPNQARERGHFVEISAAAHQRQAIEHASAIAPDIESVVTQVVNLNTLTNREIYSHKK
jgi:hypothetical protein